MVVGDVKDSVSDFVAEMRDVKGSGCFENCETEFRCSKCIRQGCVEHQCCGAGSLSAHFGKLKKDGKSEDGDCHFHVVNEIIEELLILDMDQSWNHSGGRGRPVHAGGGKGRERMVLAVQGSL